MLNVRTLVVLVVLVVLALAAAYYVNRPAPRQVSTNTGALLFPNLLDELNDVRAIAVESREEVVSVTREEGVWRVVEKSGYPADTEQVRAVLLGVAQLVKVEPKTKNPELYGRLALEDIEAADAQAVSLTLRGKEDRIVAALIVGKQRPARGGALLRETYVRVPGDPQVWLVRGNLTLERTPVDWVVRDIVGLDARRIRRLRVEHPDGETLLLVREEPGQADLAVEDVPAGHKIQSTWTVNNVATSFAGLRLEDVLPAPDAKFPDAGISRVEVETFDGLRVRLEAAEVAERHLARFAVAVIDTEPETEKGVAPREESPPQDTAADQAEAVEGDASAAGEGTDPTRQAAEMRARLEGWVFVLPDYSVGNVLKRQEDLVEAVQAGTEAQGDAEEGTEELGDVEEGAGEGSKAVEAGDVEGQ